MLMLDNRYIKSVSERGVTYTDEFKILFIAEYENGKIPSQIFRDAGFDIDIIGTTRVAAASKRWRAAYKQHGELELRDTRKFNSGKILKRELTTDEILAKKATREHTIAPNILNRNFKQEIAGKVLLTDITYIPYGKSHMAYLSTIKDACTNKILSYQLSTRITLDIATETIKKLVKQHKNLLHKEAFIQIKEPTMLVLNFKSC